MVFEPQISLREVHSFWGNLKNYWILSIQDSEVPKTETKLFRVNVMETFWGRSLHFNHKTDLGTGSAWGAELFSEKMLLLWGIFLFCD